MQPYTVCICKRDINIHVTLLFILKHFFLELEFLKCKLGKMFLQLGLVPYMGFTFEKQITDFANQSEQQG